jgi:hypothetical protein
MPPVKRRLFNVLAAGALVLFVATVALWARSYLRADFVMYRGAGSISEIHTAPGTVRFVFLSGSALRSYKWYYTSYPAEYRQPRGFEFRHSIGAGWEAQTIACPFSLPCLLLLLGPTIWVFDAIRRRGRVVAGKCVRCGYDLRATPERCPECGAIAQKLVTIPQ